MKLLFVKLLGVLVFTFGTRHRIRTRLCRSSYANWFQLYAEVRKVRDKRGTQNSLCVFSFFSGDESYREMFSIVLNLLHTLEYRMSHSSLMEHGHHDED